MTASLGRSWARPGGPFIPRGGVGRRAAVLAWVALLAGCVGGGDSPPTTNIENSPPVASAGPDRTVFRGSSVTLDGRASSDADGDILRYEWVLEVRPAGSSAELSATDEATTHFTPDALGTYTARLTVRDGFPNSSGADTVTLTAVPPPPVANAGPDQSVQFAAPGVTVQLNGGASSDPSGLPLAYAWQIDGFVPASGLPPANDVVLAGGSTATPTFDVTDADQLGVYTISLTVSNGSLSSTDQVVISVASIAPPVANAGTDQEVSFVAEITTVQLDGSTSSDPGNLPLVYAWQIVSFQPESGDPPAQAVVLVGADTATPSFDVTALDQLGTYIIQLTVNNGTLPASDQVVVTVAKSFPAAGALLGSGLFGSAAFGLRSWLRRRKGRPEPVAGPAA